MRRYKDEPHQHCTLPRETNFRIQETIAGCLGDAQASDNKEQSTEARGRARRRNGCSHPQSSSERPAVAASRRESAEQINYGSFRKAADTGEF